MSRAVGRRSRAVTYVPPLLYLGQRWHVSGERKLYGKGMANPMMHTEAQRPGRTAVRPGTLIVALSAERGFHNLLRAVVDELGYQCYADEIHEGTVEQVARMHPAAIVVDVDYGHERRMWAVIRELREVPATAGLPVIACAAAAWLLEDQRQFLDEADVLTWSEPFDIGQLLNALTMAVSRSPAQQSPSETV